MIHFNLNIADDGTIDWQGAEVKPGPDVTFFVRRLTSLSEVWNAFEMNGVGWLHPVSQPEGEWTVEPDTFINFLEGVCINQADLPRPPYRVSIAYTGGILFSVLGGILFAVRPAA